MSLLKPTQLTTTRYITVPQTALITSTSIQFLIASPLTFTDVIIKPYSSTRTRYELSCALDCSIVPSPECTHLWSTDPSYPIMFYTVTIIKNSCAITGRTSKLFLGGKFNICLELWSPKPDFYLCPIVEDIIISQLPYQYGEICVSKSFIPAKRYKTGIVIPFYSRGKYVSTFLKSLVNTDLTDCLIVMIDESMTKDISDDHYSVYKQVDNFSLGSLNENTPIIKIFKYAHGNMYDSLLRGFDLLHAYCDTMSTIDSDTIQKHDWIAQLHNSLDHAINDTNANILISGFNVESSRHVILERTPEYIIKNSVGGCHMMFPSSMYIPAIRPCLVSHKWDSNIVANLNYLNDIQSQSNKPNKKYKIITTNPSVIQHIGINTSISTRIGKHGSCDHASDFN